MDNTVPQNPPTYNLTLEEKSLVEELTSTARTLQQQAEGALKLICRTHHLDGDWRYQDGVMTKVQALQPPLPGKD